MRNFSTPGDSTLLFRLVTRSLCCCSNDPYAPSLLLLLLSSSTLALFLLTLPPSLCSSNRPTAQPVPLHHVGTCSHCIRKVQLFKVGSVFSHTHAAVLLPPPADSQKNGAAGSSGLYDRARPDYPSEAIDQILSRLAAGSNSTVVELGAGTGLFTRGFLERAQQPSNAGKVARLVAVEPSEGMRQGFMNKLDQSQGTIRVECEDGLFDQIPVEDASADLVRARIRNSGIFDDRELIRARSNRWSSLR